jgi:hypothetical protein
VTSDYCGFRVTQSFERKGGFKNRTSLWKNDGRKMMMVLWEQIEEKPVWSKGRKIQNK